MLGERRKERWKAGGQLDRERRVVERVGARHDLARSLQDRVRRGIGGDVVVVQTQALDDLAQPRRVERRGRLAHR